MTRCSRSVMALLSLMAFSAAGHSQIATTSLRGTVTDPSGAVLPNVTITLTDMNTGKFFQATSSSTGGYVLSQLPPSKYIIKAVATGFSDQQKIAELLVNQPATVDFAMAVQASSETVNVSAEAQTLNTTDASLGTAVNNETIKSLPSEGRSVPELLALQPGVLFLGHDNNQSSDSRSGSVNGGRSDQGNVTLDGLDDNNLST